MIWGFVRFKDYFTSFASKTAEFCIQTKSFCLKQREHNDIPRQCSHYLLKQNLNIIWGMGEITYSCSIYTV